MLAQQLIAKMALSEVCELPVDGFMSACAYLRKKGAYLRKQHNLSLSFYLSLSLTVCATWQKERAEIAMLEACLAAA